MHAGIVVVNSKMFARLQARVFSHDVDTKTHTHTQPSVKLISARDDLVQGFGLACQGDSHS